LGQIKRSNRFWTARWEGAFPFHRRVRARSWLATPRGFRTRSFHENKKRK